jgi:hypothetical protein
LQEGRNNNRVEEEIIQEDSQRSSTEGYIKKREIKGEPLWQR